MQQSATILEPYQTLSYTHMHNMQVSALVQRQEFDVWLFLPALIGVMEEMLVDIHLAKLSPIC